MNESDRRSALACLSACEVNFAELKDNPAFWEHRPEFDKHQWMVMQVRLREYQHQLANPPGRVVHAVGRKDPLPGAGPG
jgi:hypothetical protein